jgi:hypothetical protein
MTVVRTPIKLGSISMIKEHWTSENKDELIQTFDRIESEYPQQGYGTMLTDIRQDPTGLLWHAQFSRFTSCD